MLNLIQLLQYIMPSLWQLPIFFFVTFFSAKKSDQKKAAGKETALSPHRISIKLLYYCGKLQRGCDGDDWLANLFNQ